MINVIWVIVILLSLIAFRYWIIPVFKRKIAFYMLSLKIKRMANEKDKTPEAKQALLDISEGLKQIGKDIDFDN